MPGTIDSAVISRDDDEIDKEAKQEQQKTERERARRRAEGPLEQAPGEMPPDQQR